MGLSLFSHAVRMVFNHFGEALRISGLLYAVYAVIDLFSLTYGFRSGNQGIHLPDILAMIAGSVLFLWIAIGWHRFILLDDAPGAVLPTFRGGHMLTYFGNGLLVFLASLPILFGAAILFFVIASMGGSPVLIIILTIVSTVAMLVVFYRLAAVLPATAIDRPISIGQAWSATKDATGSVLLMAVISAIVLSLIDLPATLLASVPGGTPLAIGWMVLTGWFKIMFGISVLTTIYGHYVEGRSLA
jgi:hypothetical protein